MLDTTYCSYIHCPFTDCEHHANHLKKYEGTSVEVRVSWLCDTCRRYIGWLVDKATEQNWWRHYYERKEDNLDQSNCNRL